MYYQVNSVYVSYALLEQSTYVMEFVTSLDRKMFAPKFFTLSTES